MPRPSTRAPAITDVAKLAGVSVPTVSRVLTGSVPVSKARRERVLAAIEELGYRPNGAARALVKGHQSVIAVLASNTTRYGYALTIQGIEEAARAAGFIVMITVIESEDAGAVTSAVDLALRNPVSGVVVLKFDPVGVAALRALPKSLAVVAASGSRGTSIPHATLDDTAAASEATDYLLKLGHTTVHHVAIPSSGRRSGRALGWQKALERAGAEVPEVMYAGWEPRRAHEIGFSLASRPDVTAVLCGNDELAIGLMRGLYDGGRRVPDDISVVGFDGHPLGELWAPSLTTVEQDFAELGRRSFDLVAALIEGKPAPMTSARQPHLVIRESAAPPRD
ncbi:LacI family DNA-binding transcriptional regulator [Phytoactinopolyspora mesophila]|uniref:LacI family DNA-binding transcriptional regulator n=1 Tax=Phytoactinopolyspora mesophila TaxID=2650750 RepID=A0A7K3M2H4_9ACTN|nr:LacI family DNA-binding transcriptional regulator [Phytoactinopolyspora mesophila]NDL57459.1 LacI family DNA-binding transcriptional regulator [Phytoactinopolyspora mesophila]